MEIRRCEKGHFYDAEANDFCPQCAAEQAAGADGYGSTEPVGGMDGYGATEPADDMPDYGPTEPVGGFRDIKTGLEGSSGYKWDNMAFTGFANGIEDYDAVTEAFPVDGVVGFMPVVGWLVCIEGPARGADYRIRAGYNYIGRAEHMDICVKGDNKIAREKHALLAYDQEERVFFFGPADGKSIVRLNGKMVMNPQEIKLYDVLTIGFTKLMFIPLCGEGFDWNGNEN